MFPPYKNMKKILWVLLIGIAVYKCIATPIGGTISAPNPTGGSGSGISTINAGSGVTIVTNSLTNLTISATGGSGIATNNGTGTGTTISNLTTLGGYSRGVTTSNTVIIQSETRPTNIYVSSATFSGSLGGNVLTASTGGFVGLDGRVMPIGTSVNPGGGVDQVLIFGYVSGNTNQALVFPKMAANYTNVTGTLISPIAVRLNDNNGTTQGAIDGGGCIEIPIWHPTVNGIQLIDEPETNSWAITSGVTPQGKHCFAIHSYYNDNKPIKIANAALEDSFTIQEDSTITMYGITNVHGSLGIYGGIKLSIATKSTSYNITTQDNVIVHTGSSGHTFTLPTAIGATGQTFSIKNSGSSTLTLNTTSSQTIFTTSAVTSVTLQIGDVYVVISDGANWQSGF